MVAAHAPRPPPHCQQRQVWRPSQLCCLAAAAVHAVLAGGGRRRRREPPAEVYGALPPHIPRAPSHSLTLTLTHTHTHTHGEQSRRLKSRRIAAVDPRRPFEKKAVKSKKKGVKAVVVGVPRSAVFAAKWSNRAAPRRRRRRRRDRSAEKKAREAKAVSVAILVKLWRTASPAMMCVCARSREW